MHRPAGTSPSTRVTRAQGPGAPANGLLFLLGVLADPTETFHRARGRRYWPTAAVLLGSVMAVELGRREAHPVVWIASPIALLLCLMASYPLTAIARAVCGGPSWLTDATASQGVVLTSAASLPGALLFLLGVPALSAFLVSLVLLVVAVVAQVALWSAAFACRWWLAAVAYAATIVIALAVTVALAAPLAPTA